MPLNSGVRQTETSDNHSVLSTILRTFAVLALLAGAVSTWRDGRLSVRERRALVVLTLAVLGLVGGVLLWAARQPGG